MIAYKYNKHKDTTAERRLGGASDDRRRSRGGAPGRRLKLFEVVVALAMGRLVEEGGVMSSVARLADHSYAIDLDA